MYVYVRFEGFLGNILGVYDIYEDDRHYGKRNNNFVLTHGDLCLLELGVLNS